MGIVKTYGESDQVRMGQEVNLGAIVSVPTFFACLASPVILCPSSQLPCVIETFSKTGKHQDEVTHFRIWPFESRLLFLAWVKDVVGQQ